MRRNYLADATRVDAAISLYEQGEGPLIGLAEPDAREAFIEQVVDSERRVQYFDLLQSRSVDPNSLNPGDAAFHPLKAAILHREAGDFDEACWLIYLYVHFGRHRKAGWRYVRDVYGALGGDLWTWERTSNDITAFRYWLDDNQDQLRRAPGPHGFGNHRKYESLKAWTRSGTGEAFESYISWVQRSGGDHPERFDSFVARTPQERFDEMFRSLGAVARLGRIGRFDLLTTLHRLHLVDARPPHSYLVGATGPLTGARLLLDGADGASMPAREAQARLARFSELTSIAPDVAEDAVCNWQKSPTSYQRFVG